jgi:hypothetical protein
MAFLSALTPDERGKINTSGFGIKGIFDAVDKLKPFIAISRKSWIRVFYEKENVFIGLYTDNPELPFFANFDNIYCWSKTIEWTSNTSISCFLKTQISPEISEAKFHSFARVDVSMIDFKGPQLKKFWIENVAEMFAPICPARKIEVYPVIDNKPRKGFYLNPWTMARKIDAGFQGPRFIVANDASSSSNASAFEMGLDNIEYSIIVRDFDKDDMPFNMMSSLSGKIETFSFEYIEVPSSPFRVTAFRPIESSVKHDDEPDEPQKPSTEYFLGEIPASVIENAMAHIRKIEAPEMNVELLRIGMPEYFARRFVGFEPFKGYAGLNHSRARKIMLLFSKIVALVMSTAAANWPEDNMPISWTVGIFSEVTDFSVAASATPSQFASLGAEQWSRAGDIIGPRTAKAAPRIVESGRAIVPTTSSPLPPTYVVSLNLADHTISNPLIKDSTLKSILLDCVIDLINHDLRLEDRSKLAFLCISGSDYLDAAPAAPIPAPAAPALPPSSTAPAAPAPSAARPGPKRRIKERFTTVKLAWDEINDQYPECRNMGEEARRLKMKSIESEIRGNRFAKPPKGTCGAGGNHRDFRAKVPYLMREMQEAANSGVSKNDFYHLLANTDIFYTKAAGRDRDVDFEEAAAFPAATAAPASAASAPEFVPGMSLGDMQKAALAFRSQVMNESGFEAARPAEMPKRKKARSDSEESYEPEYNPRPRRAAARVSYCEDDDGMYD